jgi:hypothetical protein
MNRVPRPAEPSYEWVQSLGLALLLVVGAGVYFWYTLPRPHSLARSAAAASAPSNDVPPLARASVPNSATASSRNVPPPQPERALDEVTLMTQLRGLVGTHPEQALTLARRGDTLFPDSSDAAERSWSAVKSLTELRRFHEAQAEARLMLERYPGTPWTDDAERHTLIYPLDQPSREEQQAAAER